MLSAWSSRSLGSLTFLSAVPPFPVIGFIVQGFHLGEHLQVEGIPIAVYLLLSDQLSYPAVRFFPVFTVPESAGGEVCFFKAWKMSGELLR